MKRISLLLLAALSATAAFAQIQLEHTYSAGQVWRTRLDVSGETYALHPAFSCDVTLHDATHTEKTRLSVNAGSECGNYSLSEKVMDGDAGIELLCGWLDANLQLSTGSVFRDDDGSQVEFIHPGVQLSQLPGLPAKALDGAIVRSLPGLQIEHNYTTSSNWRLERQLFPLDGERYILWDFKNFDGYHFYDAQHSLVKTVNLAHPGFDYLSDISQQHFNADPKLEFFGSRWMGSTDANSNRKMTEVVQEDGTVLFSMASEGHLLSSIPGQPDRLLVSGYGSPQQWQTAVVDPATLTVLHTFSGNVSRQVMPDGEEIYWQYVPGNKVLIYSAQYQLLKTVALPNSYALSITRGKFSKGNKFEFCYNVKGASLPNWVRCSDEDGAVLYEFPGAERVWIDRQEGMADRFFVPYGTTADSTQVYKFIKSTSVSPVTQAAFAAVAPNPFQHSLEVQFAQVGDYQLTLLNSIGQTVLQHAVRGSNVASVEAHKLPPGVYWLRIEGHQPQTIRVVKIQ